jgi:branched-chain amino acid transport system permease protein
VLTVLIYGAVTSAIFAMLAVGFTLIFGVARILNLAHGTFYALGAYATFALTTVLKVPLLPAAILAVAFVALFGVVMERVLVRPLRGSALAVLMITLAVALTMQQVLFLVFGSQSKNVPAFINRPVYIHGVSVDGQRLLALVVAIVLIASLWLFIQRTRAGSAILAISQDAEAAQYMGIPSNRIFSMVMGLSAALAGAAGVIATPFLTVRPTMDLVPMITAFSVVIVGGLGSIPGSILAALIIGYSETIVAFYWNPQWTGAVSLIAVLLTLVLRPSGLMGKAISL